MLLNSFRIFLFLILFSTQHISASDTIPIKFNDILNNSTADPLQIPLYEQYGVTSNPLLNQLVINTLRWATVGTLTGAAIGGVKDMREQDHIFIPATVIIGGIGMGVGFLFGTVLGTVKGFTNKQKKASNPEYFDRRCHFGYEVQLYSRSPISNRAVGRYEDNSSIGLPSFSIVFRPLNKKRIIPDNLLLGYYNDWWGRYGDYSVLQYGRLKLRRIESCFRYDFINLKLLIPYWSVGLGYSWGTETEDIREPYYNSYLNRADSKPIDRHEYNIKAPVFRGYIGNEFNLFDFCYADFKVGYEIIGPYLFLNHKEHFPYVHNLLINFSIGTYIF